CELRNQRDTSKLVTLSVDSGFEVPMRTRCKSVGTSNPPHWRGRKDRGDLQRCQGNAKRMRKEFKENSKRMARERLCDGVGVAGRLRRCAHAANFVECTDVIR